MFDNKNHGPNASTLIRWFMLGSVTCISAYAAFVMESDDSFLVNLFGAFCIAIGSGISLVVFSLIGGLIDRFILRNQNGKDTAGALRYGLFFVLLMILVFSIAQFC